MDFGFTAEVRRGGIFKEIGKFKSAEQAFEAAEQKVSTSAAASLRIKNKFGQILGAPIGLSKEQFEPSKKEFGVFIEKPSKRIKSQGEKQEITYKGLAVQKAKGNLFSSIHSKNIFA